MKNPEAEAVARQKEPVTLAKAQKTQAGQMLARAFLVDPTYTAIFPDKLKRERALQRLFGAVVGYSLVYGLVYTTPGLEGAACWLSPGNAKVTVWRMLRTGFGLQRAVARFSSQARQDFLTVLAYLDEIHEREVPRHHWYLWALGVEPKDQGQGIGSRLLHPVLTQADADGVPCYLETQTEANVAFYQKRGFHVVSDGIVPGQQIRVWTMLRSKKGQN